MQAILYCRTSSDDQTNGIKSQRKRLRALAQERGWKHTDLEERASGKTLARRPILRDALDRLDDLGANGVLCTTALDRLARSTGDFAAILARAEQHGWQLVVLDLGGGDRLDTSSGMGKAMARMVMVMAELERDLISERTKAALQVVKARGVQLGHPSTVPTKTRNRIRRLREQGLGYRAIAARLNSDGVPGPRGPRWYAASVKRHAS